MITLHQNVGVKGEYAFRVYKANGELKQQVGPFKNLITNDGLNSFGGANGSIPSYELTHCFIGTSNTPPTVVDTDLGARKFTTNLSQTGNGFNTGAPDYIAKCTRTWRFNPGEATGNLTEVGVGISDGVGTTAPPTLLFSRALIVDSGGSPTSITVLADEYLDVTYTLGIYPDKTDTTNVVNNTIDGTAYTFVLRRYNIQRTAIGLIGQIFPISPSPANYAFAYTRNSPGTPITLGAITSDGLVGNSGSSTVVVDADAYVQGSYTRTVVAKIALDFANFPLGIQGMMMFANSLATAVDLYTQCTISPPIMKTNIQTLSIRFSVSWARRP